MSADRTSIILGNDDGSPWRFSLRGLFWVVFLVCLILAFVMKLPAVLGWAYRTWQVGEQFDQHTFSLPSFDCRVAAFHERGRGLAAPGAFYRYEVKAASDDYWRRIATFRGSSPEPITNHFMTQVTNECAYFYHEHVFGVTVDSGETWSIKGGPDYPPVVNGLANPIHIETVAIYSDGVGEMKLSVHENQSWIPDQVFVTSDFGQTWAKEQIK